MKNKLKVGQYLLEEIYKTYKALNKKNQLYTQFYYHNGIHIVTLTRNAK